MLKTHEVVSRWVQTFGAELKQAEQGLRVFGRPPFLQVTMRATQGVAQRQRGSRPRSV